MPPTSMGAVPPSIESNMSFRALRGTMFQFVMLMAVSSTHAQLAWEWSADKVFKRSVVAVHSMATLHDGNVYIIGNFQGTIIDSSTDAMIQYDGNNFLAKVDERGRFLWLKSINVYHHSGYFEFDISVNSSGLLAIASSNLEYAKIDTATLNKEEQGSGFACIAVYDTSGRFLWVNKIDNRLIDLRGVDISQRYVVVTGSGGGNYEVMRFSTTVADTSVQERMYWAVYDALSGQFIRYFTADPRNDEVWNSTTDVVLDENDNIYTTGAASRYTVFGSDTLDGELDRAFITKHDITGSLSWLVRVGSIWGYSHAICAADGSVIVAGVFSDTLYFNDTIATDFFTGVNAYSSKLFSTFVVRVKFDGTIPWVRAFTDTLPGNRDIVDIDSHDSTIAIVGNFERSDFVLDDVVLTADSARNYFAATMDQNGRVRDAIASPHTGSGLLYCAAVNISNDVYVGGTQLLRKASTRVVSVEHSDWNNNIQFVLHNNTVHITCDYMPPTACSLNVYNIAGELLCTVPTVMENEQTIRAELPASIDASVLLLMLRCGDVVGRSIIVK